MVKMRKCSKTKKTLNIRKSNLELIRNLQKVIDLEERKTVSMTDIVNVAIAELFNKKDYMEDVDYITVTKVLKCYNIL